MSRPFSTVERTLLNYVLDLDPEPHSNVLHAQISMALFKNPWFDGSQSFDIELPDRVEVDPTPPTMSDGRRIGPGCMVYLAGKPHETQFALGELFFWIVDGRIDSLEYPWFKEKMPDCLPGLDQLG